MAISINCKHMTKLDSIIENIIKKINQKSKMRIENENLFRKYVLDSLRGKRLITFYNWECPPRILDKDKKGKIFINYCVDLEKVFRGKKIDEYTEIPRVVKEKKREIKILEFLMSLGLKFRFVKIIADTNAYYITPRSCKILGKREVENTLLEFKRKIEKILRKDYRFIETKAFLFTILTKKYQKEYRNAVMEILKILLFRNSYSEIIKDHEVEDRARMSNLSAPDLIKPEIWRKELGYIKKHLGFKDYQRKEMIDFTKRTIATYGAEGMVFDLLSKTKRFSNCAWLNIEEPSRESVEITNCLRNRKGLGKLPMIFPK